GLHHAAPRERVGLEEVRKAGNGPGDPTAVGRHFVEAGPTANVPAALEAARSVGEARPDLGLEEPVPVVIEIEAASLVGNRIARERVRALRVEVEVAGVDDHPARAEVDAGGGAARV